MKKIEAIIRAEKASEVCSALESVGHHGMTLTHIEEQGEQKGWVNQVRALSRTVNLLSRVKVEVAVQNEDLESIIKIIREAALTGSAGDGTIFVHELADALRIRTGESGIAAI